MNVCANELLFCLSRGNSICVLLENSSWILFKSHKHVESVFSCHCCNTSPNLMSICPSVDEKPFTALLALPSRSAPEYGSQQRTVKISTNNIIERKMDFLRKKITRDFFCGTPKAQMIVLHNDSHAASESPFPLNPNPLNPGS